jgi:hypothetical protein
MFAKIKNGDLLSCGFGNENQNIDGLATKSCYAVTADRFQAPKCLPGYCTKALIKSTADDWDGNGSICCFAKDEDSRLNSMDPFFTSDITIVSRSLDLVDHSYDALVDNCIAHQSDYGVHVVVCPGRDTGGNEKKSIINNASFAIFLIIHKMWAAKNTPPISEDGLSYSTALIAIQTALNSKLATQTINLSLNDMESRCDLDQAICRRDLKHIERTRKNYS